MLIVCVSVCVCVCARACARMCEGGDVEGEYRQGAGQWEKPVFFFSLLIFFFQVTVWLAFETYIFGFLFLCVCVCARARARACVCVCVCASCFTATHAIHKADVRAQQTTDIVLFSPVTFFMKCIFINCRHVYKLIFCGNISLAVHISFKLFLVHASSVTFIGHGVHVKRQRV